MASLFLWCRTVIEQAAVALRNAAGNYYVNDKSTGSIVAQQPFGGARASGRSSSPWGHAEAAAMMADCVLIVLYSRNQWQARRPTLCAEVDFTAGGEADPHLPQGLEVPLHGLRGSPPWAIQQPTACSFNHTAICTEPRCKSDEWMNSPPSIQTAAHILLSCPNNQQY